MVLYAEKFFIGYHDKFIKCIREAFMDWEEKKVISKPLRALYKVSKYNNSEYLAKSFKELIEDTLDRKFS